MPDFVYTENDMAIARSALELLKREKKALEETLWAVVKNAGGRVVIPNSTMLQSRGKQLISWTSAETDSLGLKTEE